MGTGHQRRAARHVDLGSMAARPARRLPFRGRGLTRPYLRLFNFFLDEVDRLDTVVAVERLGTNAAVDLAVSVAASSVVFLAIELEKRLIRRRGTN